MMRKILTVILSTIMIATIVCGCEDEPDPIEKSFQDFINGMKETTNAETTTNMDSTIPDTTTGAEVTNLWP